jgi:hypothetical protein
MLRIESPAATFPQRMRRIQEWNRCSICDAPAECLWGASDAQLCQDCYGEVLALNKELNKPPLDAIDWAFICYGIACLVLFLHDVVRR